jgi:two-component system phosphate regulon sensor histidine kinase PhoR
MSWLEIGLALLAAVLAAVLWRELREFRRLRNWVSQTRLSDPPEAEGAWGEVFNSLHRHRRATLKRRRELAQLMVRSRRGAQALPYGVSVLDADYRLDWCNAAAQDHLGLNPERDRNQPIVNVVRAPEFVEYLHVGDFSEPAQVAKGVLELAAQTIKHGG